MIGILVSGHINFASGMQSGVDAIVGEQENVEFIDFVPSISPDELEQLMLESIERIDTGDGVLILADIPGGTPCNRALSIMLKSENIKLIAGANLPMISNACFERDGASLDELVEVICDIGYQSIKDMAKELALLEESTDLFEDCL